jgi:hypothetical protein
MKRTIWILFCLVLLAVTNGKAGIVVLTFDQLPTNAGTCCQESIMNYYNGGFATDINGNNPFGPGPNLGVIFPTIDEVVSPDAFAPSQPNIFGFNLGGSYSVSVPGGFTNGFSFDTTGGVGGEAVYIQDNHGGPLGHSALTKRLLIVRF